MSNEYRPESHFDREELLAGLHAGTITPWRTHPSGEQWFCIQAADEPQTIRGVPESAPTKAKESFYQRAKNMILGVPAE